MIKAHLLSLRRFLKTRSTTSFLPTDVVTLRHAFSDVRMALEELMLMSVSAHKESGETISRRLRKEYHAVDKMTLMRALNPGFFPDAIDVVESTEEGIAGTFVPVHEPYLTEEDVKFFYSKAGDILHAKALQHDKSAFDEDVGQIERFLVLTERLLRTFEVDISGQGYLMLGYLKLDEPVMPELFFARQTTPQVIDTSAAHPTS